MLFSTFAAASLLSLAAAAPTAVEKRWPTDSSSLQPSAISIYHHFNGAIDYGVSNGEVSRAQWNGRDNSTLVTYDLNSRTLPATCSFKFWLESDSASLFSGTGQVDIFSSLQPAPVGGSPGWGGPGNQRYLNLGRFEVKYNGNAVVITNVAPNQLNSFPCPKIGDFNVKNGLVGYEIVPVGDSVRVEWSSAVSGLLLDW